jgi:hypothetical protein
VPPSRRVALAHSVAGLREDGDADRGEYGDPQRGEDKHA